MISKENRWIPIAMFVYERVGIQENPELLRSCQDSSDFDAELHSAAAMFIATTVNLGAAADMAGASDLHSWVHLAEVFFWETSLSMEDSSLPYLT